MALPPVRVPTTVKNSLRSFLQVNQLEDRTVPTGDLFYFYGNERVALQPMTGEIIVKGDESVVSQLTASGQLSGFQLTDEVRDGVFVFRANGPTAFSVTTPIVGVDWAAPVYQVTSTGQGVVILDEAVIALDAGVQPEDYFASRPEVRSWRPLLGTPDQFVVTLAKGGVETLEFANTAHGDDGVAWATPNFFRSMRQHFTPNDPLFSTQWHLRNTGSNTGQSGAVAGADANLTQAWDIATGSGIVVAVLDDGIQTTHPDLAANIFVNAGEISGDGIDNDGNGFVDDVNGFSFNVAGGIPTIPNPPAGNEHGTSVAGIAVGVGNNGLGTTGAAFNARILPVQMFNGASYVGDANTAQAIYYAAGRTANGLSTWSAADVINCSWGGGAANTTLTTAFTWASTNGRGGRGVPVFISSGNGGNAAVSYPANLAGTLAGVMAVGASNDIDTRSGYSQWGPQLDFLAPSSDFNRSTSGGGNNGSLATVTTDRTGTLGYNPVASPTGDYTTNQFGTGFGGTSSASPLAAGVGALVLSVNPNLTAAQVRATLRATADKVGGVVYDSNGFNIQYGYGRIDAFAALQSLGMQVAATTPANGSTVTAPPAVVGGYRVDFNFPFSQIPADIDLSKVAVNGVTPTSYTVIDADTLQFNFTTDPVTAQGNQSFTLAAGAVKRLTNGELSGAYTGSFRFDTVALTVTATTPPVGGTFTLPGPFTFDVDFSESIAAGSVGVGDLTLTQGAVTGAIALDANTARYTISGVTTEAVLGITVLAGAVTDTFGNPNPTAFSGNYQVDIGTVPYPTPLTGSNPRGSLIYAATTPLASGLINFAGDTDSFTLNLDPNQTISIVVTPTSPGLQPRIELFDPSNASLGFAAAPAAGQITGVQSRFIATGGTYRIAVSGATGTTGNYTVRVILNSAFETEGVVVGSTNNTPATAQNIDGSFLGLNTSLAAASRGAVSGTTDNAGYTAAAVPFGFTDISSTGTRTLISADDSSVSLNLAAQGFAFPFYGAMFSSLFFTSNGLITFNSSDTSFGNSSLATSPAQPAIAALWDDLHTDTPSAADGVYWQLLGSGANQQLVIQWNQIRYFDQLSTLADTITFQAILSEDGTVRLNYPDLVQGTSARNNGAQATVGVRGPVANPSPLLLAFNNGPNAFVGTGQSTLISPPAPIPDFYSFNATAGQRVSVALTNLSAGNVDVQLLGTDGTTVLASGVAGATNLNEAIQNVPITVAGTYFVRVTGGNSVQYSVVVTEDAVFDAETNDTLATAQNLTGTQGALGAIVPVPVADGFETGNLSAFPWTTSGNVGWTVSNQAPATGSFSARSGVIGNSQSSTLSVALTTQAGNISFDRFVSSEAGWDFLNFSINNVLVGSWSGVVPYSTVSYPVSAGNNVFTWTYIKDGSIAANLDAVFIDNVVFPLPPLINEDWYRVTLGAGETVLEVETRTPGDGPGNFVNVLNPKIQVFTAGGVDITGSVTILGDGRNERVRITGLTAGATYSVRVSSDGGTTGEYFVGVKALRTPTITTKVDDALPFSVGPDGTFSVPNPIANGWRNVAGQGGYMNDYTVHTDNVNEVASNFANWSIRITPDPITGQFELFTSWVARPQNATNATYEIREGTTLRATVVVNQQVAPNDVLLFGNTLAESLGVFTRLNPATTFFTVRLLTVGANGDVVADGVFDPPVGDVVELEGSPTIPSSGSRTDTNTVSVSPWTTTDGSARLVSGADSKAKVLPIARPTIAGTPVTVEARKTVATASIAWHPLNDDLFATDTFGKLPTVFKARRL